MLRILVVSLLIPQIAAAAFLHPMADSNSEDRHRGITEEAGLLERPEMGTTAKDESSDLLLNLYQRLEDGEELSAAAGHTTNNTVKTANTVRSFAILGGQTTNQHRFLINVSHLITKSDKISFIEVRFRPTENLPKTTKFRLGAKIIRNGQNLTKERKFGVQVYREQKDGFSCLDITFLLKRWRRKLRHNDMLDLTIQNRKRNHVKRAKRSVQNLPLILVFADNDSFLTHRLKKSLKFVKTGVEKRLQREKRGTRRRHNRWRRLKQKRKRCQPYGFQVDFESIGWGPWIVHPKRFNAQLCFGICPDPVTHDYNPSNHAVMQSLMRIQSEEDVPRTCCVPTKLRPLSLLYYDKDQIILRHHRDLIAAECGCL